MSITKKVLIVGKVISYNLVDVDLLFKNGVEPWFVFLESEKKNNSFKHNTCYVDQLRLDEIKRVVAQHQINHICCFNDNYLLQVAQIREDLGLPGIKYNDMKKFKWKSAMYDSLKDVVNTIPFINLSSTLKYEHIVNELGSPPFFIKPDDLAGAEGTKKIENKEQFLEYISSHSIENTPRIIQPYIEGKLYHCDLMVEDGEVIYSEAREYSYPNHKILEGKIIASFPIDDKKLRQNLEHNAHLVQKKLSFNNGVMHTEFFINSTGDILFLETNIRQPGGAINLIHKERAGISIESAMVLLELGKKINIMINNKWHFSCGYIPVKDGRVEEFNIPLLSGDFIFDKRVSVGDICTKASSASNASISYLARYDSLDQIRKDFDLIEQCGIVRYS